METLNKEEKEELLELSHSDRLKEDFQNIRNNRNQILKGKDDFDLDTFIKFLTQTNAFANHKKKPFKRIEGNKFKL